MDFPLFKLTQYGVFDSNLRYPNTLFSPSRTATEYEIEVFPDDLDGKAYLDDTILSIKRGLIIIAKPNQIRHSLHPVKCLNIHLVPKNTSGENILNSFPDYLILDDIYEYVKIFNSMIVASYDDFQIYELFLESQVLKILTLLKRDCITNTSGLKTSSNKALLLEAEKYIKNNFDQPISLEKLAKLANMSPTYFHKLFRSYFNKTPNQYILDLRIANAKLLLLKNDNNLIDIAFMCGFSSQSYFCQIFKKQTGRTPLNFRNDELTKLNF